MINCLWCKNLIENPREYKGEIIQKFCKDECRWKYHNSIRREEAAFFKQIISFSQKILGKRGS